MSEREQWAETHARRIAGTVVGELLGRTGLLVSDESERVIRETVRDELARLLVPEDEAMRLAFEAFGRGLREG